MKEQNENKIVAYAVTFKGKIDFDCVYATYEEAEQTKQYFEHHKGFLKPIDIVALTKQVNGQPPEQPTDKTPAFPSLGWICPSCGAGNAPSNMRCYCKPFPTVINSSSNWTI